MTWRAGCARRMMDDRDPATRKQPTPRGTRMAKTTETSTVTEHETEQIERANASGRVPVVFVHGLWLLPSSWERWAELFEEAGFTALTPGWPDDPETVAEANANPEVFARKGVGQVADHFDGVIRSLDAEARRHRPFLRRAARADPCRTRPGDGVGGDRPGAVPWRAAAADLGAPVRAARAPQPGQPQPGRPAHLRAVPLRLRQRGRRGRGEEALRDVCGARPPASRSSRRRRRT